jgi:catechol 2,3-dioxygenase
VPSRLDLSFALLRLAISGWPLDGASDHLVSEALYLSDPDGNGIEIYRDRPRDQWRMDGPSVAMATLPLDLDGVLRELPAAVLESARRGGPIDALPSQLQTTLPAGTAVGHVHLQVADLRATEEFYSGVLGFDVMQRSYPGALFVSAGGYHHHLGLNTWHSRGAPAPAAGAVGLRSFEVRLGDQAAHDDVLARVEAAGVAYERLPGATLVRDPSGNTVELTA